MSSRLTRHRMMCAGVVGQGEVRRDRHWPRG